MKPKLIQNVLIIVFLLLRLMTYSLQKESEPKYIDGNTLTILSRPCSVTKAYYRRIDSLFFTGLPEKVKYLSTNSSGIQIMFQTNSRSIDVRWKLREYISKPNITPVAINGMDLYGWNGKEWQYVASAMPEAANSTATFIRNLDGQMRHYRIYLPLYSELTNIEIGIDKNADIKPADPDYLPKKSVAIYGSSITQGASASRPGMAYPSILGRMLNVETFNMGFSGAGKMEIELVEVLAKIDADLYVLDCVPNTSPEQLKQRALPFIQKLRMLKPNTPILMVESIFRETGNWNVVLGERVIQQNQLYNDIFRKLRNEGDKQLYYIPSGGLLGDTHDATIDGTHPNDIGHQSITNRISKEIVKILKL